MSAMIPFCSSCKDDETVGEWDMSYVYLLPVDYLRPTTSFSLSHIEDKGIEGNVEYSFRAVVQKPSTQDIKVNLTMACDGISEDNINVTAKSAIIKAGQTASDTITITIDKWDDLLEIKQAANYTFKIDINSIEAAPEVVASEFRQGVSFKIAKSAEKGKQEVLLKTPTRWLFTFMPGVENAGSNSVAGTGGSDVATNGTPFWITVDLMEVKTLTGIQTRHWAPAYAPTKVELFSSENGNTWTSIGTFDTKSATQIIKFEERIKTRYLKYQMITVPGRVDITQLYVYSWE